MIGTVILKREEIKKFITSYFNNYENVFVNFKQPNLKTGTGIIVYHTHKTKNETMIKLEEELEVEDVKEIFTNVFFEEGYVVTNVDLNITTTGEGYGEYTSIESIKIKLNQKEKVKQKTF